ncbi:hypothetical protein VPH35_111049 [Triticum aestivum]
MRARLSGGHFRMLNEKLYTCSGQDAFDYFKNEPELFDVYHAGYQEQMSHWPEQPVNVIIKWLKSHNKSWTVADFGCGNAAVAKNVKNKVFSIDLVSDDPSVIACDMAHTPLEPSSVDVAIFCLSLMGTNFPSYLQEANRVLKPSGWLLIAEVRSRLDPDTGGADPDKFSEAISQLGFSLISKNYRDWVQHMKLHMRGQLVWEHLSGALPCPLLPTPPAELAFPVDADETKQREMLDAFEEATEEYQNQLHLYKQWTNDDARASSILVNSMDVDLTMDVVALTTAYQMWEHLRHRYESTGDAMYLSVVRQEQQLQQGDATVDDFYKEMSAV